LIIPNENNIKGINMKREAMLYKKLDNNKVQCNLCAHECKISEKKFGICGVRKNIGGTLYTLVYSEAISSHVDPIEKKPLYHLLPGSGSYSIATVGCNFKCDFCQNWQISQSNKKDKPDFGGYNFPPSEVVKNAKERNCKSIAYTYTEPTIYFEYAFDTAKLATEAGLYNVFVTNGFMTKAAIETIEPYLDAANVDLKSFSDKFYKKTCKGRLQPVLDSIKLMRKLGIWVEVTTLVVTNQNDSEEELNNIAKFIASIGKEIPWHISRFHPDYRYTDSHATPIETLRLAYEIGKNHGLHYVYLGNVHEGLDTRCKKCDGLLLQRAYMGVNRNNIKNGKCSKCNTLVDGIF
jgi:pyruvate formate lyase activating enzyme